MDYSVRVTKTDWPMILALASLEGNAAPPITLAETIRYVHREAGGEEAELATLGLSLLRWSAAELSVSAIWLASVLTVGDAADAGAVRSFAAWLLRAILTEMGCRIKKSEPPKPAKPSRPTGPMN